MIKPCYTLLFQIVWRGIKSLKASVLTWKCDIFPFFSVTRYIPTLERDGQVIEQCAFPWTDVNTGRAYQACLASRLGYWCPTKLGANSTFDPKSDNPNVGWCEDSEYELGHDVQLDGIIIQYL